MIKKIQLYTICIVIIVIVISQFALMDDSQTARATNHDDSYNQSTVPQNESSSKYNQPIEDISKAYKQAQKSVGIVQKAARSMRDLMDVEKNLNQLSKILK